MINWLRYRGTLENDIHFRGGGSYLNSSYFPSQKSPTPHFNKQVRRGDTCLSFQLCKNHRSQAGPGKNVAQVAECLLSRSEALSSNSSSVKKSLRYKNVDMEHSIVALWFHVFRNHSFKKYIY
jgi:hypothetical protein